MAETVEAAIFELLEAKVAPGKSVSPEEVARAVDREGWRRLLGQVRNLRNRHTRISASDPTKLGATPRLLSPGD